MAQMSPRERIFAALTMRHLPDQLPVAPLLMTRGIREGGITCDYAQTHGEAQAHAKMKAVEKFGGDVMCVGTDLFTPVECLGAELDYLPYAQPSLVRHPAPTREAFQRLRDGYHKAGFNPLSGRMKHLAEEAKTYIAHGRKSSHFLLTPVGGPLTTAQLITGSAEFLNYLSDDPAFAKEVIELALDVVQNICQRMFDAGIDACNIMDPFCASDIIPPETFREFGLPYQQRLFAHIKTLGGLGFTHVPGYTQPIWRDLADNGSVNLNGDMYPGMDHAKRAVGSAISLMGGLSANTTMMHGGPGDVANEIRKLAATAGYNGGFICMPGSDLDWTVPDENIRAMTATCAAIRYPLNVAGLGDLSGVYLPGHPKHPGQQPPSTLGDVTITDVKTRTPRSPQEEVCTRLVEAITAYDGDKAVEWTKKGLALGMTAERIVNDGLALGMKVVGDLYDRRERFVTDVLKAARTMDQAMPLLASLLGSANGKALGTVVLGVVRGNAQDIGKNLVSVMLKANGFKVIDLGKNVKPEQFVETAEQENAVAIGMSVASNSSTVYLEKVRELLDRQGKGGKYLLLCGGAACNPALAGRLGMAFGQDANQAVSLVRQHVGH